jgi:TPR repeat protein
MIDVGYLPGARGYFQRAAEAGSAEAAYALGTTYDPTFIHDTGAQGIKGDLAVARSWFERARELGSQAAQERLQELTKSVAAKRAQGPNE